MNEVNDVAEQTAGLAGNGQAGLTRMEETMRHVMDAAGSINGKLAVLNEKAGQHQPGGDHHHEGCRPDEFAFAQRGH